MKRSETEKNKIFDFVVSTIETKICKMLQCSSKDRDLAMLDSVIIVLCCVCL